MDASAGMTDKMEKDRRSLRVLHVITGLDVGGAETMLVALVSDSRRAGMSPSVVSLLPNGVLAPTLRRAGIELAELNFAGPVTIVRDLARLIMLIRRQKPDIVQGWMYHGDLAALLATILSGRRRRTKVIWGIRCSNLDLRRYSVALRIVVRLCTLFSRLPDLIIANSEAGLKFHRALGYRTPLSEVAPNGIDIDRFKPNPAARQAVRAEFGIPDDAILIAHAARLDPSKDHGLFLAAMRELPDLRALLIGTGTETLPGADNLHRLGRRRDIPELLSAADIIVSSSAFGEGFSNVIAEGMACGLPVVATDVGDARAIAGEAGRIIPPGDKAALIEAIRELASLPAGERSALGALARRRVVDNFSLCHAVDRFAGLYAGLATKTVLMKSR
jgi:glycosyltransferase involved in cell wall biosynthesis